MSTEIPCWCQVTGKEQLAASAPAHGPFRRGSAARGTKAGEGRGSGGGRLREASMQSPGKFLCLFPICSFIPTPSRLLTSKQVMATKCCLSYLMLLITMPAQSQLSPQNRASSPHVPNGYCFLWGRDRLNTGAQLQLKGPFLGMVFKDTFVVFFLSFNLYCSFADAAIPKNTGSSIGVGSLCIQIFIFSSV